MFNLIYTIYKLYYDNGIIINILLFEIFADYNGTFRNAIYQPVSENHVAQVVTLHHCLNTNSLGQLLTSSMPYLYPFIVQFR